MCSAECVIFGVKSLLNEVKGKRILEVGSEDVNGSLRSCIIALKPKEYIGVDIWIGPGVDKVCKAEELIEKFGKNSFDIVIATELLEHVMDWRSVISNIKNVCKPGGIILITTRSYGFGYHAFPNDFWRYEANDLRGIFSDCKIEALEEDKSAPGVFLKAKKQKKFIENDVSKYALYSIVKNKRIKELTRSDLNSPRFALIKFKVKVRTNLSKLFNRFFR